MKNILSIDFTDSDFKMRFFENYETIKIDETTK
jgi:hypothetical protein